MSARIFKYDLEVVPRQILQMPPGKPLYVAIQNGLPKLWVLHPNPNGPIQSRIFRLVTTGEEFASEGCEHIGTFEAERWFIGHVFEQLPIGQADVVSLRFKDDFNEIRQELSTAKEAVT